MSGIVKGSIIHIHRARTIIVDTSGLITSSGLGREFFLALLSLSSLPLFFFVFLFPSFLLLNCFKVFMLTTWWKLMFHFYASKH